MNSSRSDIIRRAIMLSMSMTGERYKTPEGEELYSHDDYDAAHQALNELVTENKRLSAALEVIANGAESNPAHEVAALARKALDGEK